MIKFSLIIDDMINKDFNFVYTTFHCTDEELISKLEEFKQSSIVLGIKYLVQEGKEVSYWFGEEEPISHYANLHPEVINAREADELLGTGHFDFVVLKNKHLILVNDENKHVKELVTFLLEVDKPKIRTK